MPQSIPAPEAMKPSISSSHSLEIRTIQKPKVEPSEDQSQVLLALSDEYYNAAKKVSAVMGVDLASEACKRYYEYMSLCTGCLETAINVSSRTPILETNF
jgi:hypothetical protein